MKKSYTVLLFLLCTFALHHPHAQGAPSDALPVAGTVKPATATLTGPSTGVAHAAGSILCSSASQCTAINFTVTSIPNGTTRLTRGTLIKSTTSLTNASFRLFFYSATPTFGVLADAGAYSPVIADAANRQQYMDCLSGVANSNNAEYSCTFPNGSFLDVKTDATGKLYGWMQAQTSSYTAGNSETFRFDLIGQPMSSGTAR